MAHQNGNVGGALAQGRGEDGEDLEPVIEVAAELLLGDHLCQIAIGGGNQAHVHGDGPRSAQALDLALLQGAQQLGLQIERQFAHLVEKQRALVSQFHTADFASNGARERALSRGQRARFRAGPRESQRNST